MQNRDTVVPNHISTMPQSECFQHSLAAPNSTAQQEETNCVTGTQEELLTLTLITQNINLIYRDGK